MSFALVGVAAAAVCSGAAAVLQARAVHHEPPRAGLDATLLIRLARRPAYLLALLLVVLGFALSFLALRTLPLFVVQSGRSASLAVTAVLSVAVLRTRLTRVETGAVLSSVAGLVLLAGSAAANRSDAVPDGTRLGLLVGVVAVAAAAALATRVLSPAPAGRVLAVLAGLAFAALALGARTLRDLDPPRLVADPAAWAMGLAGLLGLLLTAQALHRTPVVVVTVATVATETLVGSALGMALCGDSPAPGAGGLAVTGFVLVLGGALSLARFGAPEDVRALVE